MRTPHRIIALAAILAVIAIPTAVLAAGGTFTDDETSVFEADIEWMAATGVTKGCNPPANDNFCPDDAVSRGAMAAFLHRYDDYLGRSGVARKPIQFTTTSTTATELDTVTVDVPGPGTLVVEVAGQYWLDLDATSSDSAWSYVQLAICDAADSLSVADCGDSLTDARYSDPDDVESKNATPGIATSRIVTVDTAGPVTFSINGRSVSGAAFHDWYTYVQATFLPGTNSLDGAMTVGSE
jgi:hypothetical protein